MAFASQLSRTSRSGWKSGPIRSMSSDFECAQVETCRQAPRIFWIRWSGSMVFGHIRQRSAGRKRGKVMTDRGFPEKFGLGQIQTGGNSLQPSLSENVA